MSKIQISRVQKQIYLHFAEANKAKIQDKPKAKTNSFALCRGKRGTAGQGQQTTPESILRQEKPTRQRIGAATPAQKVGIRLFMSEERKKVAASAFFPTFVR